ncbi:hypothetical protein GCM10025886_02320 [Tetragenococcus halophilus subsp. flandriensis]|uniref:hypothetical protein n=1 Tax=Tetragenococcus halophilus TaxID=51669 RepID=UPI0023E9815F|nr:hypothetical protein [Tetragenococcus halophilus]GMA07081.1 hypothetical protein GCM10025886_02320 [Tetragenococcus halophilus subsp. flandriensis]
MKKYLWISVLVGVIFLTACNQSEDADVSATSSESTERSESTTVTETTSNASTEFTTESTSQTSSEVETIETTDEIEETGEETEEVNLGTIYYEDLDTSEPIQSEAQWLGCYIVDDGTEINFIPMMSATIQNLQLYLSGEGNEDYYNDFLDSAVTTSLHTGGKPVNILSNEDGEVIITAQDGEIIYSM